MRRFLRRGGVALALVVLAGGQAGGPVRAADEQTELQIELVGLPLSNTQRELQVRVTNVSPWWAEATTARVETLKPTPGNAVDNVTIPQLNPGDSYEFTYMLEAACNGHEVKAEVRPAKNYADVSGVGHTTQTAVCPARIAVDVVTGNPGKTDVIKPGTGIGRGTGDLVIQPGSDALSRILPEYLRPGTHAVDGRYPPLTLTPTAVKSLERRHRGGCGEFLGVLDGWGVGWEQISGTCPSTIVTQTAVNFDLSQLDEVSNPLFISTAVLTFDENVDRSTDGNRVRRQMDSCVNVVGIATVDWTSPSFTPGEGLFPNQGVWDNPAGSHVWDVGSHVRDQMRERANRDLRYGYILRGKFDDVQGDDNDTCESYISNPRLTISYIVLE